MFQLFTNGHAQNPYPINLERIYFQDNLPSANIRRTQVITPSKEFVPSATPSGISDKNVQEVDELLAVRLDETAVALTNFSLNLMKVNKACLKQIIVYFFKKRNTHTVSKKYFSL